MWRSSAMDKPETIALVVASLAAVSSLVNAVVSILSAWRDNRGLKISLIPKKWNRQVQDISWGLKVWNQARTTNSIVKVDCLVDGEQKPYIYFPGDAPFEEIKAFSFFSVTLVLKEQDANRGSFEKVEFRIYPVRGRCRRFSFRRKDLPHSA